MSADIDALNYPYIRVRSADWLKRTLLIFPHVVRMSPDSNAPADDPEVEPFCFLSGSRGPLLRSAHLGDDHVRVAQRELVADLRLRIDRGKVAFRKKFGRHATKSRYASSIGQNLTVWEKRLSPNASFQIHRYKLDEELTEFLIAEQLAWKPESYYSDGSRYLEMHPRLGEAVMATLAVACAENEGLQVVTEFPRLHGKLLGTSRENILSACLDGARGSGRTSGQQVAEFLVYRRCNVDRLSAESIADLKKDNSALIAFRGKLDDLAKTLPATIHGELHLEERLNDSINEMIKAWEKEQTEFSRRLFGEGVLPEAAKLAQKLAEAAVSPTTLRDSVGPAGAGGLLGMHAGNLTLGLAAGAGTGFAVALVYRGIEAWRSSRKAARESPLRYLTQLQDQGVSFSVSATPLPSEEDQAMPAIDVDADPELRLPDHRDDARN
jgi:hypothetical protein